jgi:hypothetical protein
VKVVIVTPSMNASQEPFQSDHFDDLDPAPLHDRFGPAGDGIGPAYSGDCTFVLDAGPSPPDNAVVMHNRLGAQSGTLVENPRRGVRVD